MFPVIFFGAALAVSAVGWFLIARDVRRRRPIDTGLAAITATVTGIAAVALVLLLI
jgi:hypothetical protein